MSTSSSTSVTIDGTKRTRTTTTITYRKLNGDAWAEDSKTVVIEEWDESPVYLPAIPQPYVQPVPMPTWPAPSPGLPTITCSDIPHSHAPVPYVTGISPGDVKTLPVPSAGAYPAVVSPRSVLVD